MLKTCSRFLSQTQQITFIPMSHSIAMSKLNGIAESPLSPEDKKEQYRILAMNQAPALSRTASVERAWAALASIDYETDPEVTRIFLEQAFRKSDLGNSEMVIKSSTPKSTQSWSIYNFVAPFFKNTEEEVRTWRGLMNESVEDVTETSEPTNKESKEGLFEHQTLTHEMVNFSWLTGKEYGEAFFGGQIKGHHTMSSESGVNISIGESRKRLMTPLIYFQTPAIFTGKAPKEILQPTSSGSRFLPARYANLVSEVGMKTLPAGCPDPRNESEMGSSILFQKTLNAINPETDISIMRTVRHAIFYDELRHIIPLIPFGMNKQCFDYTKASRTYTSDPNIQKKIERFMKKMVLSSRGSMVHGDVERLKQTFQSNEASIFIYTDRKREL